MAQLISNFVFKKILRETAANKRGTEDPYFEYVPAADLNTKPSKKLKRRKKPLPPGITEHEAKVLTKVKRRAYRLDNSINICGIRFGWSSIIGLIPGLGDCADILLALLVYRTCCQIKDLDTKTKALMYGNIMLDFVVGLVPFLGDFADALFRCNTRNAVLLEKFLYNKYNAEPKKKSTRHRTETADDIEITQQDRHHHPPSDLPPSYETHANARQATRENTAPSRPERAVLSKTKKAGGWFGSRGSPAGPDLERGQEPEYEYRPAQPPRPRA